MTRTIRSLNRHITRTRGKRPTWKSVGLMLVLVSLLRPGVALAQEKPLLSHSYTYGQSALFRMNITGLAEEAETELFLRVNDAYTWSAKAVVIGGSAAVTRDLKAEPLPPFASITYWWTYTSPDGDVTETPQQTFKYLDDRFAWQTATADPVRIHWITGERTGMEQALDIARDALKAIDAALQTPPLETIDIYVYPSQTDLASAMQLGGHVWVGGVAYPELAVILIAAPPNDEGRLSMQQDIPHELTHMALYRLLGSQGYAFLPTWLNEGLATYFETRPDPAYAQAIQSAQERGDLIPLAELCAPFPEDPARAFLAYAQSGTLVHYLRQNHGWTPIRELLQAYADGQACSTGTKNVIGQDMTQLDREWRLSLARDDESFTEHPTSPSPLTGTALFLRDTAPWLMLLAALAVPAVLVIAAGRRD